MANKRNSRNKVNKKKNVVPKQIPIEKTINSDAIAAALSTIRPPVLLKVCRLCEAKDGPFLNIFDAERVTAKKIENVMPFAILENDDLPHKICFRCSAKVEELYEFIQKCIKTQENLGKAVGKNEPLVPKVKTRTLWEEKLNKSNITNEDICNALIKKAMEGIKDKLPKTPVTINQATVSNTETNNVTESKNNITKADSTIREKNNKRDEITEDQQNLDNLQVDKRHKNTRSKSTLNEEEPSDDIKESKKKVSKTDMKKTSSAGKKSVIEVFNEQKSSQVIQTKEEVPVVKEKPPFDIMDHVSMIKVNGVGVLFQCKLCNRNFLKKEVVMAHGCAKNGAIKVDAFKEPPPPEPPKQPTVKYITTKPEPEIKKPVVIEDTITLDDDDDDDEDNKPLVVRKKPKMGPASKVKKAESVATPTPSSQSNSVPQSFSLQVAPTNNVPGQASVVQMPSLPSLNSRYKLVPGPNNTFTLVEEPSQNQIPSVETPATNPRPEQKMSELLEKKELPKVDTEMLTSKIKHAYKTSATDQKPPETSSAQPYPVGLFQTMAHNSNSVNTPGLPGTAPFMTPAMKKHSYTVVQTGNPSKLLISSKAQQPEEEVPKKRQKKARTETKEVDQQKQPYAVTLEDVAPPRDPGFFTFINVDPLLQPSYVLPTNNIIQESQISTSTSVVKNSKDNTAKDKDLKYTCNMCKEKFNREKKLLAHIQVHYKTIEEENQSKSESKTSKKRGRSSVK